MDASFRQEKKSISIGEFIEAELTTDIYNGERLDTRIEITGDFWIAGNTIEEFCDQLKKLVQEFFI